MSNLATLPELDFKRRGPRGKVTDCQMAFMVLVRCGGTIDITGEEKEAEARKLGLDNIWEDITYHHPHNQGNDPVELDLSERARWDFVKGDDRVSRNDQALPQRFEQGFAQLAIKLPMLDPPWRLYRVPRTSAGRKIEVITLDPHYPVNPAEAAEQIHAAGAGKRAESAVSALGRLPLKPEERRCAFQRLGLALFGEGSPEALGHKEEEAPF